ncbi:MAG: 6-phosphogluconolactonase [Deltaproteobacteria bacterium]|nr:6-phosphogluconolactonase [Deltaproteobacteria bacterium]
MKSKMIFNTDHQELFAQMVVVLFREINQLTKDKIVIAVPGGRSIVGLLKQLASRAAELPHEVWGRLNFFMVDERLVPIDSEDSNYKLVFELCFCDFVKQGLISEKQLHPFIYQPQQKDFGASTYEQELNACGGVFDIVLLGVGEDGHAAALYPRHPLLSSEHVGFLTLLDSPKPPSQRMTSSLQLLRKAKVAMALFIGEAKKDAYLTFCSADKAIADCPAKIIEDIECGYVITDIRE